MSNPLDNIVMPDRVSSSKIVRILASIKEIRDARSILAGLTFVTVAWGAILGSLTAVASVVSAAIYIMLLTIDGPAKWIALSVSILIAITSVFLWRAYVNRIKNFSHKQWQKDFKLLQVVSSCCVISKRRVSYRYRYVIRPKRPMRVFDFRYHWTGDGDLEAACSNPKHKITKRRDGEWGILSIDLGREIDKTVIEIIQFDIKTDSYRKDPLSQLALIVLTTHFPMFNTHIIVNFSDPSKVGSVYKLYYYSTASRTESKREAEALDSSSEIRWSVLPVLGRRYAIEWDYAK